MKVEKRQIGNDVLVEFTPSSLASAREEYFVGAESLLVDHVLDEE